VQLWIWTSQCEHKSSRDAKSPHSGLRISWCAVVQLPGISLWSSIWKFYFRFSIKHQLRSTFLLKVLNIYCKWQTFLTVFFEYNCKFREAELWQFQIKINFYPIPCMAPPLNLYLEPQLNNEIETSHENQRETQKNYLKKPLNNFCIEINKLIIHCDRFKVWGTFQTNLHFCNW